MLLNVTWK